MARDSAPAHRAPSRFGGSLMVTTGPRGGVSRITPFSKTPTASGACVETASAKASSGSRMPTNTTSPSRISRAAQATMSSRRVQAGSAPAIARPLAIAQPAQVLRPVGDAEHPALEPGAEAVLCGAGAGIVPVGGGVVAAKALQGRGMRAAGPMHHRRDQRAWQDARRRYL